MVRSKKLLFSGLFSALFLCITPSYGATDEDAITAAPPISTPLRPTVPTSVGATTQDEVPVGCWNSFTDGFSRCWRKTGEVANVVIPIIKNDVLPVLRLATLFLDPNADQTKDLQHAIGIIETGTSVSEMVFDPQNGSLKLPDGTVVGSALWYVLSEKSALFTDDSTALASVVINRLLIDINGDSKKYKTISTKLIHFVTLLAGADVPTTPIVPGFDAATGTVHLRSLRSPQPLSSIPIFDTETSEETKEFLKTCFSEFVPAYEKRTTQEEEGGGERIPGAFLPENGTVLSTYNKLRESNPLYKIITAVTEATA